MKRITRERWLPVVGYEGKYEVSDQGRVRSYYHGRWLKATPRLLPLHLSTFNYIIACLSSSGTVFRATVSRLVLEAFVGPAPIDKPYACHGDRDTTNNRLTNLRWGSNADNQSDRNLHGTSNKGEANGKSKLTEKKIREIKKRLANHESQASIAIDFKVDPSTISNIHTGKNWSHI